MEKAHKNSVEKSASKINEEGFASKIKDGFTSKIKEGLWQHVFSAA